MTSYDNLMRKSRIFFLNSDLITHNYFDIFNFIKY